MAQVFVCVLQPSVPIPLLKILGNYLQTKVEADGEVTYFYATDVRYGAMFVGFDVVYNRLGTTPYRVSIPPQYLVAIAERGDNAPIGFRPA